jgi:hypothetical protein
MSSYTKKLVVSPYNSIKWQLEEPFAYYTNITGKRAHIMVPRGFITDFASTPRFVWSIYPTIGNYSKAAVLHDYLYKEHKDSYFNDRKTCDLIFREAMEVSGVDWLTRNIFYWLVRMFGKSHWEENN